MVGSLALSAFICSAQYDAQEGQGPGQGARDPMGPDRGFAPGPPITIHVTLEDGAALLSSPVVILPRTELACRVENAFLSGTITFRVTHSNWQSGGDYTETPGQRERRCYIWRLSVPGYRTFQGWVQEGTTITLRRLGEHEGSEVSLTALSAPPNARKAYDRGEAAMAKKKWAEAEKHFEEAVAIYPTYAPAWSELGSSLREQNRLDDAMNALQKARSADPKYIKPIVQMAGVEGRQEHWEEELHTADEALAMHPVSFPGAHYYHAEACYHLGLLNDAADSVHTAIETDLNLELPEAHFLAGLVLAKAHQRSMAVQEFQQYLQMAPKGEHAAEAKAHIAELTRRAGPS